MKIKVQICLIVEHFITIVESSLVLRYLVILCKPFLVTYQSVLESLKSLTAKVIQGNEVVLL